MRPEKSEPSAPPRLRTKKRSIVQNLQNRQLFGRLSPRSRGVPPPIYHTIPRRLVFKLSSCLPIHFLSIGHVFLGFLRNGNHVVSYTKTEEYRNDVMFRYRYHLQFWWFTPTYRLELHRQIELFSVASPVFITVSEYSGADSRVVAVGHPLDLLYEPDKQSMVLVTVAAVPSLKPCTECSARKSECLEHGFIFQTACSLNVSSVTDPKIMGGVDNHVLINTTSTLVCHEIQIRRNKTQQDKSQDLVMHDEMPTNAQTPNNGSDMMDVFFNADENDPEPEDLSLAFKISEPLRNAQNWVFSQSMSKRTMSYFCEKIYSKERSNLSLYNGSKDRPLFLHLQLPEAADEYVETNETQLEFDYCCGFIGQSFCAETQTYLASILNYDGRILDFCPYSRIVTISLCIQIDTTTTAPSLETVTCPSVHVGYELFVVLLWSVPTGELRIRHLQHQQFSLDSKNTSTEDCPAFKNLREELAKEKSVLAFSGLLKEVREAIAAALGDKFKYLTSHKECDDFIAGFGSTKVDIPASL